MEKIDQTVKDKNYYFKYIVLELAKRFVKNKEEENNYDWVDKFNEENDFGDFKIVLFPFLITIASTKREYLITKVFNKFYPSYDGIIDQEIDFELRINKNNWDIFKLELGKTILNKSAVKDFYYYGLEMSSYDEVVVIIDNSINALDKKFDENFARLPQKVLLIWNKSNGLYKPYFSIFNNDNLKGIEIDKLFELFTKRITQEHFVLEPY